VSDVVSVAERLAELEREQTSMREVLARVEAERARLEAERGEYRKLYLMLLEENERLKRGLLGQKSERLRKNEGQLTLAMLGMMLGDGDGKAVPPSEEETVREHTRRKPTGRKPLPEHLPRVEIEVVPEEVKRLGLDAFERIGAETSEVLERRPASHVVVRVVRPKFVLKDRAREERTHVLVAEPLELPIERGLAGPGLLADTVVRRWQDHLPLNRQEGIFAREGVELSRSTMCGWHAELSQLARPVVEAMRQDALMQPYLCIDATGVLVQAKERCRTGHFWVLVAPEKHVLFGYTPRHDRAAVDEQLRGYEGMLVADAHVVYDHLYASGDVEEVCCWAHSRRYFFKAMASDPERAGAALAIIGKLFKIERSIATAPRKKKEYVRKAQSAKLVDRFFAWCHEQADHVLDDTPIADGIRYARNQEKALRRFLEDGRLPMDNNVSERQLRREVLGRRNWIFLGTDDAGDVNAIFVSLLASCAMHRIEPWAYLRDLFCLLPRWPHSRALELAPAYWTRTLAESDAQERLDANPFRAVTLGPAPNAR